MKGQTWKKFKKGDLIITKMNFPAIVYKNQTLKNIIEVYAFGWFAEHGTEYAEDATKTTDKKEWFALCEKEGHSKEEVLEVFNNLK